MPGGHQRRVFASIAWYTVAVLSPASPSIICSEREAVALRQPDGPSFNCARLSLDATERRICRSRFLSHRDLQLSDVYAEDAFESFDALGVVRREAHWLALRDRCDSDRCLRVIYDHRIDELQNERAAADRRRRRSAMATYVGSLALTLRLRRIAGARCIRVDGTVDAGDGRASIVAHTCGPYDPTDRVVLVHPEGRTYRVVFDAPQSYVYGLFEGFQDHRSHGLRRIITFTRNTPSDHQKDFYDYDGRSYRHVATLDQRGVVRCCRFLSVSVRRD